MRYHTQDRMFHLVLKQRPNCLFHRRRNVLIATTKICTEYPSNSLAKWSREIIESQVNTYMYIELGFKAFPSEIAQSQSLKLKARKLAKKKIHK